MPPVLMVAEEVATTFAPLLGDTSPVVFGIEHEYNFQPDGSFCDCGECEDINRDDEESGLDIPDGWEQHPEHCGWEVKTPPTVDIASVLDGFARIERQVGGDDHHECGLHIHLNATPSEGGAVNPLRLHANFQALKHEHLYPFVPQGLPNRDHWAKPLEGQKASFADNTVTTQWVQGRHERGELAASALSEHGTVEVRLGGATGDMEEFEQWVRRILGLAALSMYAPDESPLTVFEPLLDTLSYGDNCRSYLATFCQVTVINGKEIW